MAEKDRQQGGRFAPFLNIFLKGNPLSEAAKKEQLPKLKKLVRRVDY